MIQLSDYDYPIVISPLHFHHYFKSLADHQYADAMRVDGLLQDLVKSIVVYDKNEQASLLMKK